MMGGMGTPVLAALDLHEDSVSLTSHFSQTDCNAVTFSFVLSFASFVSRGCMPRTGSDRQDLDCWLNDRNCELRNEMGDVGLVAHIGGLVGSVLML